MVIGYIILLILCNNLKSISSLYDDCPSEINPKKVFINNVADFKSKPMHYKLNRKNYQGVALHFNERYIKRLPTEAFVANSTGDLVEMNLGNKSIRILEEDTFKSLTCLRSLDLSRNEIASIKSKHFLGLTNLLKLNISLNTIYYLDNFVFKFLPNLQLLDLSFNNIVRVKQFSFYRAFNLEWLSLKANRLKVLSGLHFFQHQLHLKHLDMADNAFGILVMNNFRFLDKLETWDISGNGAFLFMGKNVEVPLFNVRFINISHNQFIKSLTAKDLKKAFPNDHLTIDINDNAFYCDYLEQLLKDLRYYMIHVVPGRAFNDTFQRENILCDVLIAHAPDEEINEYYEDLYSKIMLRKTTWRPPTRDYEIIYETYRKDSVRHKHMLTALSILVSIALLYNILIATDYLFNYGYLKNMCAKPRVESNEPIELMVGPLVHNPL